MPIANLARRAMPWALACLLTGCAWGPFFAPRVDPELQKSMDQWYARGAVALSRNDLPAALAAWRQYVAIAPARAGQARKVRGYLTLLDRENARRYARQVARREAGVAPAAGSRLQVALFPLKSLGPVPATGASFNRALMAMITTDLGRVPSVTLLEREKVDHLVRELKLAESDLVDPATALEPGRMLGAGTVVVGSVYNEPGPSGPGSGRYRINTVVSTVGGGPVATPEADGSQDEFFVLQKRVVYGILKALQVNDLPPGVHRVHTRSWQAYTRFAVGLRLLDEDRFDEARKAFQSALDIDPAFALAEEALLGTPEMLLTLEQMQAETRPGR